MFDPNCGIYVITSPSGKRYVGQSVNIRRRWIRHKQDLKSGIHVNRKLLNTALKYGVDSLTFSVWCNCAVGDLGLLEQIAYDEIKPELNLGTCGDAPLLGKNHTEATKRRLRLANLGRKMSPEAIEKVREARAKQVFPPETLEKRRKAMTGRRHTEAAIERMRLAAAVRSANAATRAKLSETRRAAWALVGKDVARSQMAAVRAHWKPKEQTRVRCIDSGREFSSVDEVKAVLGHDPFSIRRACRGVRKTAYGMRWEFIS